MGIKLKPKSPSNIDSSLDFNFKLKNIKIRLLTNNLSSLDLRNWSGSLQTPKLLLGSIKPFGLYKRISSTKPPSLKSVLEKKNLSIDNKSRWSNYFGIQFAVESFNFQLLKHGDLFSTALGFGIPLIAKQDMDLSLDWLGVFSSKFRDESKPSEWFFTQANDPKNLLSHNILNLRYNLGDLLKLHTTSILYGGILQELDWSWMQELFFELRLRSFEQYLLISYFNERFRNWSKKVQTYLLNFETKTLFKFTDFLSFELNSSGHLYRQNSSFDNGNYKLGALIKLDPGIFNIASKWYLQLDKSIYSYSTELDAKLSTEILVIQASQYFKFIEQQRLPNWHSKLKLNLSLDHISLALIAKLEARAKNFAGQDFYKMYFATSMLVSLSLLKSWQLRLKFSIPSWQYWPSQEQDIKNIINLEFYIRYYIK